MARSYSSIARSAMDTTTDILPSISEGCANAINPGLHSPISYSHIYTMQEFYPTSSGQRKFKLPESDNVYWTEFKVHWLGLHSPQFSFAWIDNDANIEYDFPIPVKCENGVWNELTWPIPAFHYKRNAGFYIIVDFPEKAEGAFLQIDLLGFEQLFDFDKNTVLLCDELNQPQWKIDAPMHDYLNYTLLPALSTEDGLQVKRMNKYGVPPPPPPEPIVPLLPPSPPLPFYN